MAKAAPATQQKEAKVFTKQELEKAQFKLDQLLGRLINHMPFYGRVAMYMQWEIKELEMPTAATDGKTVWFHPTFLEEHDVRELMYVAVHEIHHVIRKHNILRRGRDGLIWNIACDHRINLELDEVAKEYSSFLKPPEDLCRDEKYKGPEWLEEDVYQDLLDNPVKFTQNSCGQFMWSDMDAGEEQDESRNIDKMVEAAYKTARDAGKLPGFLQDFYAKHKEHQVPWQNKLRRFLAPIFPTQYSWEKLNRRAISRHIYCPGVTKDGVGNLAILIDTSGSVQEAELNAMLSEVNYIISHLKPMNTQLIYFESYPWQIESYSGTPFRLPDKIQSGGTNFEQAFAAISNSPKAVICLTDMYDSFSFTPHPNTIWVATTDQVAPWGETIRIKVDK